MILGRYWAEYAIPCRAVEIRKRTASKDDLYALNEICAGQLSWQRENGGRPGIWLGPKVAAALRRWRSESSFRWRTRREGEIEVRLWDKSLCKTFELVQLWSTIVHEWNEGWTGQTAFKELFRPQLTKEEHWGAVLAMRGLAGSKMHTNVWNWFLVRLATRTSSI